MSNDENKDKEFTAAIEAYLAALASQGYTPEQARRKASERLNQVRNETIQRRRNSLRVVRDAPPDKE
jgi:hypothetical protein